MKCNADKNDVWIFVNRDTSLTDPINRTDNNLSSSLRPSDLVILSHANVCTSKGLSLYLRSWQDESYAFYSIKSIVLESSSAENLIVIERIHNARCEAIYKIGLAVLGLVSQAYYQNVIPEAMHQRLVECQKEALRHSKSLSVQILHFLQNYEQQGPSSILQHRLQTLANFVHQSMVNCAPPGHGAMFSGRPQSFARSLHRELLLNPLIIEYKDPDARAFSRLSNYLRRHPFSLAWILVDPSSRAVWGCSKATTTDEKMVQWSLYHEIWTRQAHNHHGRTWKVSQTISIYRYEWTLELEEGGIGKVMKMHSWYSKLWSSSVRPTMHQHFVLYVLCMTDQKKFTLL